MSDLARKDLFVVAFPKKFISDNVNDLYKSYIDRIPTHISSPSILVKSTVQSITIPTFGYTPIETYYKDRFSPTSITRMDRDTKNPQELSDKQFTITFKMVNGYVNYWIMLDTLMEHYDFNNTEPYMFDLPVHIIDSNGNIMFTRTFKDCTYNSISEFELSYSDNAAEFNTFTTTFSYITSEMSFQQG